MLSLSLTKLIPCALQSNALETHPQCRLQNQSPFLRGMHQNGTNKVFSLRVCATQLQLSTFLSLAHFFNHQIWSPGKQFERFALAHTGFSVKTAVLFWTLQNLFSVTIPLQNHRMVDVGRASGAHLVHLPCSKEHQLQEIAQGCTHLGFEYLQV